MSVRYAAAAPRRRLRPVSIVVGLVLGSVLIVTTVGLLKAGSGVMAALATNSWGTEPSWQAASAAVWQGLSVSTLNPWYWGFLALLTVGQWVWPARRDQRTLAVEIAIDAVWFVMGNVMQFTVVAVVLGAVSVAYTQVLGTWSFNLQPELGFWGLAVFAFVLTDLLAWVSHRCHHKVPTLWQFHAVHHSQQHLNALSDNRTHVGEVIAAALIVSVPSQLLGLKVGAANALAFIGLYYSAMLHSNVRSNLGPLKYIFMGPQAHRIHHSILPQHYDSNFGTVFALWDYAAGTMYKGYEEYPPTGIDDTAFPLRQRGDANPLAWVVVFAEQLVYPFKRLVTSRTSQAAASPAQPAAPISTWRQELAASEQWHPGADLPRIPRAARPRPALAQSSTSVFGSGRTVAPTSYQTRPALAQYPITEGRRPERATWSWLEEPTGTPLVVPLVGRTEQAGERVETPAVPAGYRYRNWSTTSASSRMPATV